MTLPVKHSFSIGLECPECGDVEEMCGTIEEILGSMSHVGWPICPECGSDMEYYVKG